MPGLQRIADDLAPRGFRLVTVLLDGRPAMARAVVARQGLRAPVVLGDGLLRHRLAVEAFPWLLILDRTGKPVYALRGAHSDDELRAAITDRLKMR